MKSFEGSVILTIEDQFRGPGKSLSGILNKFLYLYFLRVLPKFVKYPILHLLS